MAKTVIVTGAAGNLGQVIVQGFLQQGYHVMATVRRQADLQKLPDHPMLDAQVLDLLDEAAVNLQVSTWIKQYGTLDAALLLAGGFSMGGIKETGSGEIRDQYQLNFETAYHIARPVFLHMMEKGSGRIFLTGARSGTAALYSKGQVAYGLSKSLLFRLAEFMNEEARGTHVVVSVLVPATIDTPENRRAMPEADFSTWVKPESIADVLAFYCSNAATHLREPVIKIYGTA